VRCIEWCTPVLPLDAEAGLLFNVSATPTPVVVAESADAVLEPQLRTDAVRIRRLDRMHWELAFTTPDQPVDTLLAQIEQVLREHAEVRTLKRTMDGLEAKVGGVSGLGFPPGWGRPSLSMRTFSLPAGSCKFA
jgi:hypothetical protein